MSEETKKNPIQLVTELLAEMTARVVEAEQQRDEAQKNSDEWYAYYQKKDAELKETAEKLAAAERRYENGTRFLTGKLAEYFETVPHKATKTKESYRLLSGTLTRKYGGAQMKQDDAQLVQYLKDSGQLEFIKTEEKPKWGEFKKRLEIMGGSAVDKETGEIVEGVQIIEKPDTFSVDV